MAEIKTNHMATVKVKVRASTIPTKEGTVFYQVIHNRMARQINPGYKLYPHEWDTANAKIVFPPGTGNGRRNYLVSLKSALAEDVRRFKGIISRFEQAARNYTAEEVAECFLASADTGGFMSFGRELVGQLKQIGRTRTAERYTTVLNSFGRFRGEKDVPLDEVESNLMVEYEIFLHANDACPNTSSYYMRGLRAIYNRAVEKELTGQRSPFKHVYTGIDKTVKRAVPLKIIRQIKELLLFIKWERPMQEIVDKYDTGGSPYLLPIIKNVDTDERRQYKNAAHQVNEKLKKLGEKLGLAIPLTSYVARHAWASIAKSKNVPLATISEALGHDSEKTTRIYLASLDTSAVDKANSQILKSL